MENEKNRKSNINVRAVRRVMEILTAFDFNQPELGLTELSKKVKLPKSTLYRYLETLKEGGFISQDPETGKYRLGIKIFELGSIVQNTLDLRKIAHPYLKKLAEETGETVHLCILDEERGVGVYVDKIENPSARVRYSQLGKTIPLHVGGVGKALMAYLPREKVDEIIRKYGLPKFTKNTITDPEELKKHLQKVKEQGYSVDNEEVELGLRCVAAPIRDSTGKVIASISISGPSARINEKTIPQLAELVKETALKISYELGFKS
ncbi:IclR family transcriptional regulator [Thermococcus sp. LS2]|uniref:IclR family transcriptional regulator n=1 Tax=Thermococcus sp. LS2 TaxID=1638260 RepID=UPI00143BB9B2|nr:IclR family transcriptional regulator [Thermococcus sp. LS2]